MESKKIESEEEQSSATERPIKTTAVDTGRRIDIGARSARPTHFIRKRREPAPAASSAPSQPVESVEDLPKPQEENPSKAFVAQPVKEEPKAVERKIPLYVEPLEFDESGDFAELLRENDEEAALVSFKVGDKVSGKVVHIGKDNIFLALGPKVEAAIATIELSDADGHPKVRLGQKVTSYVVSTHGGVTLSNDVAQSGLDVAMLEDACAKKIPVEGKVTAINKGGFDVMVSGKRAFCPVGQIDERFVEDTNAFVGRTLSFLIERVEEGGKNIVVSRRALLERQKRDAAKETIKTLELNKKYDAVITRVADFGAFADIGGLEGLIPRSEISFGHIERVSDVVSSGDRVEVLVMSFEINEKEPSKSRLSFSLKKTKEDPYSLHFSKVTPGATLEGRVVRLESFGAFVELFPGIDGLIHISELSENRVAHPKEVLSIGDPVTVRVVSVDEQEKRVALSLRESVARKKDSDRPHVHVERGQKATGVVSRIERYGVFLELDNGAVALLPQSETDLPKNTDLSRAFSLGQSVDVTIIDVDAKNRIRVSSIARKQMDERDTYLQFQTDSKAKSGFGTFADLLKGKK